MSLYAHTRTHIAHENVAHYYDMTANRSKQIVLCTLYKCSNTFEGVHRELYNFVSNGPVESEIHWIKLGVLHSSWPNHCDLQHFASLVLFYILHVLSSLFSCCTRMRQIMPIDWVDRSICTSRARRFYFCQTGFLFFSSWLVQFEFCSIPWTSGSFPLSVWKPNFACLYCFRYCRWIPMKYKSISDYSVCTGHMHSSQAYILWESYYCNRILKTICKKFLPKTEPFVWIERKCCVVAVIGRKILY